MTAARRSVPAAPTFDLAVRALPCVRSARLSPRDNEATAALARLY
jgi:hypothetical protein